VHVRITHTQSSFTKKNFLQEKAVEATKQKKEERRKTKKKTIFIENVEFYECSGSKQYDL
jgi:hypothetical protein